MKNFQNNFDRDNTTGRNHEGPYANTPVKVLTATSIIGDSVENANRDKLGSIKDLMINLYDGSIEYVVVQSGGFLGIGDKLFAVPFEALRLDSERESFILDRELEYIKNAPGFDQDHWPETNDHYGDINNYWGTNSNTEYKKGVSPTAGMVNPTNAGNVGPLI